MGSLKLSLAAIMAMGVCSVSSANSLEEAFTNGKVSGEISATYETRKQDKELSGGYYQDTAYSVGSFALKYETGVWNNLSLTAKFRAYKTLFEDDKNLSTFKGTGDASERFYEDGKNKDVDIEELFLTYKYKNITAKLGRQAIYTDWLNKTHDALKVDAVFENTSIEAIYSEKHGRIYNRDYRPMSEINENDGVYKLGLSHKLNQNIKLTAYDVIFPNLMSNIGAKAEIKYKDYAFRTHYVVQKQDDSSLEDSSLIDLKASTKIAGFTTYLGYVKIDKDAEFKAYQAGEILNPFEEGDQLFLQDAQTYYLGISKSFGNLSATLLYGITEYGTTTSYDKDETTLWLGYKINKNLSANLGYTITNEDSKDQSTTDLNQLNATLTYSF